MEANVIPTVLGVMEKKDSLTLIHLSKVQQFINLMIPKLTQKNIISEKDIPDLWTSAILHDAGKIFVSDHLLKTEMRLQQEEMRSMREHPVRGYNFLKSLNLPENILSAIKYHHERWDGNQNGRYPGYPEGVKGFDIPLFARIIQVADAFDAMISYRPYKSQKPVSESIKEIKEQGGRQFDPYISQIFVESLSHYKMN
ncbi:MAG: HD domain-containing protein [Spirochaetes bacterium]|nr:HD domain-containing protein [Spirochaetota bacterium]